jgi:hypothetical protein
MARRTTSWLVLLVLVAGCGTVTPTPAPTFAPSPTASAPTSPSPEASDGAAGILARVAPELAFVATETGTGSGYRIDERHVVTNAHVVRLSPGSVRVQSSDGPSTAAEVVGWDLLADLAVLEVAADGPSTPLETRPDTAEPGERVYLVGFPLADPDRPTTTITEGIVSAAPLEWLDDLTYHQTDATIEDGQSGGVLVDDHGRLLGITNGSRGAFAIALDATDALDRVTRLLDGDDVDGVGDRLLPIPDPAASDEIDIEIRHRADAQAWVVDGSFGGPPAGVSMEADGALGLFAMAAGGRLSRGAGPPAEQLTIEVGFDAPGPYLVKIEPVGTAPVSGHLSSSVGLTPLGDPDDGATLSIGDPVIGVADYAGDIDWWRLALDEGESVTIRASAAAMDPAVFVDRAGSEVPPAAGHDVGGPLGGDDEVRFTAAEADEYLVVVSDLRFSGAGAYRLLAERDGD